MEWVRCRGNGDAALRRALAALRKGGVIIFPTDTVYGVGGNALSRSVVSAVRRLKRRPREKAFPWLVADLAMAKQYAFFTAESEALARRVWPGAVTIVLRTSRTSRTTRALRVPAHPWLRRLIAEFGKPIIGTSANLSGMPPARTARAAARMLPGAALIVDGGRCGRKPSAVIDCTVVPPRMLRGRLPRKIRP